MKIIEEGAKEFMNIFSKNNSLSNVNYTEDNYEAGYNHSLIENTEEAFKAGVQLAQKWTYIEEELPNYYQIILADNGKYMAVVARVSDGDEDSYIICGTDIIMNPDPIKWRPIELK